MKVNKVQGMKKKILQMKSWMKSWRKKMNDNIIKVLIAKNEELKNNIEKLCRNVIVEYKMNGNEE